jgi:hypothetical protein
MEKHVVNKRLDHNGKRYEKGSEIESTDENFKAFQSAGHIDSVSFGKKAAQAESASEEQPEQHAESKHKSKR